MLRRFSRCGSFVQRNYSALGCNWSIRSFTTSSVKENHSILKNLLSVYRVAYDEGDPIVTDQEYDKMYTQLLDIESKHPELCDSKSPSQQVGPEIGEEIGKKLHSLPMLGLQNTYNDEQLLKFHARIQKDISSRKTSHIPLEYITEMKYDGMAISLIFKNGELCYGTSRGDGIYGEDLTSTFLYYVNNLPFKIVDGNRKTLRIPHTEDIVEIRGEILCSTKEFDRVNALKIQKGEKPFSTSRNLATGSLNKLNADDSDLNISLDMICYSLHIYKETKLPEKIDIDQLELQVEYSKYQPSSHFECLNLLKKWNLPICPRAEKHTSFDTILPYIHQHETFEQQEKFPYVTDGVVVKVDSIEQQQSLGRVARSYKWAIAYKFPTQIYTTKLLDIQFQIGRSGKATPVAHLEKVVIDGSNVSRATLHNFGFIEQHNIEIGDIVKVEKSGGTIPKISGLAQSKDPSIPSKPLELVCPCEKHVPLIKHDEYVDLFCSSSDCKIQKMRNILHFVQALSIFGLGESVVKTLMDNNLIDDVADIFLLYLKKDELIALPRWGEKKVDNLLQNIEKAKEKATLSKILFSLGIPNVGDSLCKQLSKKYKSLETISQLNREELVSDGFTGAPSTQLELFFKNDENQELLSKLKQVGLLLKE